MTRLAASARWIAGNIGNMLLALVLAFLVWSVAEQQANPSIERPFPSPIPIVVQNLPAGMVTYDDSARAVHVVLSAPQSAWDVLTPDHITAVVDLSGQVSGTLELPVRVTVDNRTVRLTRVEPSTVSIKMEPEADAQLPVTIRVTGEPALPFAARPVETIPATVTVRGPVSLLQQIAAVTGQLSIQDARATISQTVPLSARDRDGQVVPYVTVSPSTTLATVRISQLGGFRDLAVKIDLRGNVAPGYLTSNVSVDPQIVTVFGSSAILDALPGFISTEPVTVTNATADIDSRVPLVLPPGVSFLGDPTVQVSVKIKPIESSITLMTPLTPQGLEPDRSARLSPETIDVIFSGPIARLNSLQASDVQSFVNLFNLGIGTYQITPTVVTPGGINVVSVLPSTIQVVIGEAITPTVTLTSTSPLPTPTLTK